MEDTFAVPVARLKRSPSPVAWRSIALPAEHGGWGLLAEPLLLGLLVAPSLAGAAVAVAATGAFLFRHPARLAVADWQRGGQYPRTSAAVAVALAYAAMALAGLSAALVLARGPVDILLVAAAPFGG